MLYTNRILLIKMCRCLRSVNSRTDFEFHWFSVLEENFSVTINPTTNGLHHTWELSDKTSNSFVTSTWCLWKRCCCCYCWCSNSSPNWTSVDVVFTAGYTVAKAQHIIQPIHWTFYTVHVYKTNIFMTRRNLWRKALLCQIMHYINLPMKKLCFFTHEKKDL